MARGRPPSSVKPVVVRVALYLRPGEDDDLIAFFTPLPLRLRSSALKQALRSGQLPTTLDEVPSDDDVADALDSLIAL
jgi:hypothetical protein